MIGRLHFSDADLLWRVLEKVGSRLIGLLEEGRLVVDGRCVLVVEELHGHISILRKWLYDAADEYLRNRHIISNHLERLSEHE